MSTYHLFPHGHDADLHPLGERLYANVILTEEKMHLMTGAEWLEKYPNDELHFHKTLSGACDAACDEKFGKSNKQKI